MTPLILSIIIAIIAGSCIFGKTFWDNRLTVLGIAAVLMVVSLTSATFIARRNMPIVRHATTTHVIHPFYVLDSSLQKLPYAVYKGDGLAWTKCDANSLMKRKVDVTKTPILLDKKVKNAYSYTYRFAQERKMHIMFYKSGSDTLVGFVQTNGSKEEPDYFNINDLKIAPMDGKLPVIQYIDVDRKSNTSWTMSWVIPRVESIKCIYIPKDEYAKIPARIRSKCYFDNQTSYTASR